MSCRIIRFAVPLALALALAPERQALAQEDPYLWLEDVTGDKALDWVKQQNAVITKELAETEAFRTLHGRFLEILDSEERIPYVEETGSLYYNFWKDRTHERGIWRRATLEEYRKERPAWETVLDLDSLSRAENENWAWKGAETLEPEERLTLLSLSRGGADAVVVREFDLATKRFVPGGFSLPEAKSQVYWKSRDSVYVGTDFGPGSMTSSGYPRIVKEWKRGTPLSEARTVFEAKVEDVYAVAWRDHTPGYQRDFVQRGPSFFTSEVFLLRGPERIRIDKPDDAGFGVHFEWMTLRLRSEWKTGGRTWPAGALLVTRFEDFLAGRREFHALFEPSPTKSLEDWSATRGAFLINELDNVKNRIYRIHHDGQRWIRTPMAGLPEFGNVTAKAVDSDDSDAYWVTITDFLTPTSLHLGQAEGGLEKLKQLPAFFDAARLTVTQHAATSKDGTRVPYFQIGPKDLALEGTAPTLLYGYGGFELSELPTYSGTRGRGWLERGGVLVVANIRGGGEFGPAWHKAALKEKRHRAFEDFIAVAEDLVRRKVTSPRHLGCIGGSNGGLLTGNMLTMRPELFRAVVSQVPLLDMRRYHKLLAGASWMDEYGNPDDPKEWSFLQRYSPYHNLRKGVKYPHALFTTSTRDDRVHPGHARKMVAKMKEQGHDVLYYENVEGGHGGAVTNRQTAHMWALAYTFLWRQIGPRPAP